MRGQSANQDIYSIRAYWDSHPLGRQYVRDASIQPGTAEYFEHIRPWMSFYKFPWIRERLEREAALLRDRHLLEVGCGMGFDSVEFLRRGVRVTATDLTPTAVEFTRKHFDVEGLDPVEARVENVRDLSFGDNIQSPSAAFTCSVYFISCLRSFFPVGGVRRRM